MNLREALDHALYERWSRHRDAPWRAAGVTDDEWTWLIEEGYVDAYGRGDSDAVERALSGLSARRRAPTTPGAQETAAEGRVPGHSLRASHDEALATLLIDTIERADGDPFGLHVCRQTLLPDGLLAVEQVRGWIVAHQIQQGAATVFAGPADDPRAGVRAYLLAYADEHGQVRHLGTRIGHPLDQLRRVSDAIAAFGGWHAAAATTYVLTGLVPTCVALDVDVRWKTPVPARSRVVLTIDPTCTPLEVAEAYRTVRRRHFRRIRRLTPKHAALASFAVRHHDLPPADRMAEWNRSRTDGRYRQLAVFERACEAAVARLRDFSASRTYWGRPDVPASP